MNEKEARQHVKKLREYYHHLATFLSVNTFLFALNLLVSPGVWWFLFPLLGWGIGLFSHTVQMFGLFGLGSRKWEAQKLQQLMAADQSQEQIVILQKRLENLEAIIADPGWEQKYESDEFSGNDSYPLSNKSDLPNEKVRQLLDRIENLEIIAGLGETAPQASNNKIKA